MQYEKDHRVKPGIITRDTLWLKRGPDMSTAARSGDPAMTTMRPSVPPLVPQARWRRGALQRRCDRHHGRQFNRARYQTRRSRESARAGWCALPPARPQPQLRLPAARHGIPAATDASQTSSDRPERKEEKEEQEAAATGRPHYGSACYCYAGRDPAGVTSRRSIELISMSRILLADDSPHAQRMGERILREEGFEVVSLTDGNAAMLRLADVDPDLILADVFLPGKSGFELCRHVKSEPRFKHVRVVLTAGLLEPFDEEEAKRAGCDAILKKPFEASKVVSTIDPLVKEAQLARGLFAEQIACRSARPDRLRLLNQPSRMNRPSRPSRQNRPTQRLLKSIRNEFAPPSRSRSTPPCPP